MFCANCGKPMPDSAVICTFCGAAALPGYQLKPAVFTTIGTIRLISGILNILAGLGAWCLCLPLLLIPLGIVEIVTASNLLKPRPDYPEALYTVAILEILAICACCVGWLSMIFGIITLALLTDPAAKAYLASYRK